MDPLRSAIVQRYLCSQADEGGGGEEEEQVDIPDEEALRDFKMQVRAWMELDSAITQIKLALKSRNDAKKALTAKILQFMTKYKIDDLNTKDGKLRLRTSLVVAHPLSPKRIKADLLRLHDPSKSAAELSAMIFTEREKVPRPSLRRVNIK